MPSKFFYLSLYIPKPHSKDTSMANIFRRAMSFGNLREVAAPSPLIITDDDETVVDVQDEEVEEMDPIPNFEDEGITDPTTILEE